MKRLILLVLVVLFVAAAAQAQPAAPTQVISNSSSMSFTASSDHNAVFAGAPVLTSYLATFWLKSSVSASGAEPAGTPPLSKDLGKPTPAAGNTITVAGVKALAPFLPNTEYIAYVRAIGPGGVSVSGPTVPFGYPGLPAATGVPAFNP